MLYGIIKPGLSAFQPSVTCRCLFKRSPMKYQWPFYSFWGSLRAFVSPSTYWSTIMALLYLITVKKSLHPLLSRKRGPKKLTAVTKIKHKARPKPSSETTRMEMIHCCFINFKQWGGQRSIICVFACLCSWLGPPPEHFRGCGEKASTPQQN